ncbi:hypothetical protein ACS0TY_004578 [Phlomoides rotata]
MENFLICFLIGLLCLNIAESRVYKQIPYSAINCRKHTALLTDFGGKGDGKTSNTAAFKAAIAHLSKLASDGGAQLVIPPGKWLTGSFNLTRGNGTIDGQGESWWKKFKSHQLKNTRPYLIEILNSNQVQISDLTLINSPSWNIHPTYCRDVIIERVTITAPVDSPNTDGINPDSCVNTRIRDSYVVSGDDCIAVKSGWDQYGIKYRRPTQHLSINRFTCISPDSAVIALGSEMSGGIQDVRADNIYAINSQSGVRIKTAPGRGAYVEDIFVRNMNLNTMMYVFWMTGAYGSHPDEGYDPKALPVVRNINFRDIVGNNVTIAGDISGIRGHPFTGICISDVNVELAKKKKSDDFSVEKKKNLSWNCTDVGGVSSRVRPKPCDLLPEKQVDCAYPSDVLPIDKVKLKKCYVAAI